MIAEIIRESSTGVRVAAGAYTPSASNTDYVNIGFRPQALILLSRTPNSDYSGNIIVGEYSRTGSCADFINFYDSGFSIRPFSNRSAAAAAPWGYVAFG